MANKKRSCTFKFESIEVPAGNPRLDECRSFIHISIKDGPAAVAERIKEQVQFPEDALKAKDQAKALSKVSKESRLLRVFCGMQKIDWVVNSIKESQTKTVIFSSNRDTIVLTQSQLRSLGAQSIYGGSDPFTLEKSVNKFNSTKACQVLVCDVRGYSSFPKLEACERVVFLDPDWDSDINTKALLKCFPKAQDLKVEFVSVKDSIDSHIISVLFYQTQSALQS